MIYEEFDPYVADQVTQQPNPSAPGITGDKDKDTLRVQEVPFVYPTIRPTVELTNIANTTRTDNPPAYLRPEYLK